MGIKEENSRRSFFVGLCVMVLLSACGKQKKQQEMPSFADLKTKAMTAIESKKTEYAIAHLEQLIAQYPENKDVFEYKLMLADLYLKAGRLDASYKLYRNYSKMYPSDAKAEYATYKAILSKFYQTLKVSKKCDDTDAHKTMKRCKQYLETPTYRQYRADVRDIHYTCERRLIDKEVYVFNTYLRLKQFQSAQNRIDNLRTKFSEKHPSLEAHLLYLEGRLAQKQDKKDVVQERVEKLLAEHPESQYTRMAQGLVSRKREFTL